MARLKLKSSCYAGTTRGSSLCTSERIVKPVTATQKQTLYAI